MVAMERIILTVFLILFLLSLNNFKVMFLSIRVVDLEWFGMVHRTRDNDGDCLKTVEFTTSKDRKSVAEAGATANPVRVFSGPKTNGTSILFFS